jgi:RNA polymerase sigma-70 factor (ECF subfamily)
LIYLEDKRLAKGLIKKDEESFKVFFDFYFPRLYRFTLTRLNGNNELTKEIVQETMMLALKNMKQYRGEAALFSWLCQINRSQISLYFKKNKLDKITYHIADNPEVQEIFDNFEEDNCKSPDQLYGNEKLRELISTTLDHLPHGYGDILEWMYLDKLSVNEIADKLNTTAVSVQSRLARAREAFKKVIGEVLGHQSELFNTGK